MAVLGKSSSDHDTRIETFDRTIIASINGHAIAG
jgi:hypothetical protein